VKTRLLILVLWLILSLPAVASDRVIKVGGLDGLNPYADKEPYRIALAISGGGARGLATIGLLQAFEEKGIEVTAIAGTSMGGVIGGLYACGYTPQELRDTLSSLDFSTLLSNSPPRSTMFFTRRQEQGRHLLTIRFDGLRPVIPRALTGAQELTSLLTRLTNKYNYLAGGDFGKLKIPFKTIATDIVSGKAMILESGSLANAMRATMAFPLAFTGVDKDEQLLMDGGMLIPIPVDIVRGMADEGTLVVAINTTSPLYGTSEELATPVDIAGQVTTIMTADKLQAQLARADFVIVPVDETFSSMDFTYSDSLIDLGYRQGLIAADSIVKAVEAGLKSPAYLWSQSNAFIDGTTGAVVDWSHLVDSQTFTTKDLQDELRVLARAPDVFEVTATLTSEQVSPSHLDGSGTMVYDTTVSVELVIRQKPSRTTTRIIIIGNFIFDDSVLIAQCDFPNDLISPDDLQRAADRIVNHYQVNGFDLAEVQDIKIDFDNEIITFVIDEAIIMRVDVADNERARDWLIRSYLPFERGKPYSAAAASEGIAALYGTDLFDRVTLDLSPLDTGALVTARVKEKKNTQLRLGWHWHNMYQSEQFVELLDNNVFGVGMEFLTHAQFGDNRREFYTGVRIDRIFLTYLTARLRVHYSTLDRDLYDAEGRADGIRKEDRWGAGFVLGQQIARLGTVSAGITIEEVQLKDNRIGADDLLGLRSLHFESRVETLDRADLPTEGENHQVELRFAGKLIGGDVEFTRFRLLLESYTPLGKYVTYHSRLSLGLSRRGLPPSEKFYAGGLHSFNGFRTNELSGDKLFLLNQELRFKLPFWLYFSARFDVGDVYGSAEDIKLAKLRQGFGISLTLDSPIGPIELGWGGGDSPKDNLYFHAGYRF